MTRSTLTRTKNKNLHQPTFDLIEPKFSFSIWNKKELLRQNFKILQKFDNHPSKTSLVIPTSVYYYPTKSDRWFILSKSLGISLYEKSMAAITIENVAIPTIVKEKWTQSHWPKLPNFIDNRIELLRTSALTWPDYIVRFSELLFTLYRSYHWLQLVG